MKHGGNERGEAALQNETGEDRRRCVVVEIFDVEVIKGSE